MSSLLDSARSLFSPEERPKEWYEELEENVCQLCPSLTWQQRVIGCACCMLLGFCLSMGSLFRFMQLLEGDPVPFATMYTIGNILSLSSTCFLFGPWSQAKQMVTIIFTFEVFTFSLLLPVFAQLLCILSSCF